MEINYHNKKFKALSNSSSGEVEDTTIFRYFQEGHILWATYSGKNILFGTITGIVDQQGNLEFSYQHVNNDNQIMTGLCKSTPTILASGNIQLHETWQWTCKDRSEGTSIIEEID